MQLSIQSASLHRQWGGGGVHSRSPGANNLKRLIGWELLLASWLASISCGVGDSLVLKPMKVKLWSNEQEGLVALLQPQQAQTLPDESGLQWALQLPPKPTLPRPWSAARGPSGTVSSAHYGEEL